MRNIDTEVENLAGNAWLQGRGGMTTKIMAAKIATNAGCGMVIVNGNSKKIIQKIFENAKVDVYTKPTPLGVSLPTNKFDARKILRKPEYQNFKVEPLHEKEPCPDCYGTGRIKGLYCQACGGEGTSISNPCNNCSGTGQVKKQKTISPKPQKIWLNPLNFSSFFWRA